jgi:FAD/FMN-containing dehydrogenase
MTIPFQESDLKRFVGRLGDILGSENVRTDKESTELHSLDFSEERGEIAAAVVFPKTVEDVSQIVKTAASFGAAVVPRGGGMSYTLGYVPRQKKTVIVDTCRMNRILEINTDDLYLTVEPGVTWHQIHEELMDEAYRMPFIGTISGIAATVGGGLANNATGIGQGEIAESLLGVEVVLGDGRILQTGGRATGTPSPSLRHFGPDLTGLFVHDGGAFGIKTKATFRLVHKPGATSYASFGFESLHKMVDTICEAARLNVASELFAFESYHHEQFATQHTPSKKEGMEMLRRIFHSSPSRLRGVLDLLKVARPSGLKFLLQHPISFHVVVDGFNQRAADKGISAIKRIALKNGGKRLPPTLIMALRLMPFQPVSRLIQGLNGACSFPSNCNVPLSKAHELISALEAFFEENAPLMAEHGISKTRLYIIPVKGMFGVEPILYWRDRLNPLRLSILEPEQREVLGKIQPDREARAVAIELRHKMQKVFRDVGGAHFGIGKYYAYRDAHISEHSWNVLEELKKVFDPLRNINPGALGLRLAKHD